MNILGGHNTESISIGVIKSVFINEILFPDWLITPPQGAGTESPDDLWCGACNCIVKRKKYNAEIHMKTVKHMKAMGIIADTDDKKV